MELEVSVIDPSYLLSWFLPGIHITVRSGETDVEAMPISWIRVVVAGVSEVSNPIDCHCSSQKVAVWGCSSAKCSDAAVVARTLKKSCRSPTINGYFGREAGKNKRPSSSLMVSIGQNNMFIPNIDTNAYIH